MPFRYIIYAPQSCTDLKELDNIIKSGKVSEIYTPTEKSSIKLITAYAAAHAYNLKVFRVDWQGWGAMAYEECFKAMIEYADAAIIFTDGESKNAYKLEMLCTAKPIPVRVVRYERPVKKRERVMQDAKCLVKSEFHVELEQAEAEETHKKIKAAIPIEKELLQRYYAIHEAYQQQRFPEAYKDHGYTRCKTPLIRSATGLQGWLENIFNWSGHHMQRIASQGVYREGIGYTFSGTTNGATDDNGHFCSINHTYPIPVYIETKFNKDIMSKAQLKFQGKVERTGALHFIQSVPEDAFLILDYLKTL